MKKKILFSIIVVSLFQLEIGAQNLSNKENSWVSSRASDSLALINFNQSTSGKLWKQKWDFSKPMEEWFGVMLNSEGRVFCLDLDGDPNCTAARSGGNHLHGSLPDLQLPFLEHLFLSSNKIDGPIPNFSNISYLRTLQLSANKFSGSLPDLDQLEHLVKMDLEFNELSGTIPNFEFLPKLETIYLGHNDLKGWVPEFENCIYLKQLYIDNNKLNGLISDLNSLSELQQLILCHNKMSGTLPELTENKNLVYLDLSNNEFSDCFRKDMYSHIKYYTIDSNPLVPCAAFDVYIPNAFSPNGDGVNDYFKLKFSNEGDLPNSIYLQVWNTKGELVYESDDYENDWNGTVMGEGTRLKEGTYLYQLQLDKEEKMSGWLYIK